MWYHHRRLYSKVLDVAYVQNNDRKHVPVLLRMTNKGGLKGHIRHVWYRGCHITTSSSSSCRFICYLRIRLIHVHGTLETHLLRPLVHGDCQSHDHGMFSYIYKTESMHRRILYQTGNVHSKMSFSVRHVSAAATTQVYFRDKPVANWLYDSCKYGTCMNCLSRIYTGSVNFLEWLLFHHHS